MAKGFGSSLACGLPWLPGWPWPRQANDQMGQGQFGSNKLGGQKVFRMEFSVAWVVPTPCGSIFTYFQPPQLDSEKRHQASKLEISKQSSLIHTVQRTLGRTRVGATRSSCSEPEGSEPRSSSFGLRAISARRGRSTPSSEAAWAPGVETATIDDDNHYKNTCRQRSTYHGHQQ